ncbi:MAG: hypothetical protein AVDCRST_MAG56-4937, partial [uncultured Cytophagales bacterium]
EKVQEEVFARVSSRYGRHYVGVGCHGGTGPVPGAVRRTGPGSRRGEGGRQSVHLFQAPALARLPAIGRHGRRTGLRRGRPHRASRRPRAARTGGGRPAQSRSRRAGGRPGGVHADHGAERRHAAARGNGPQNGRRAGHPQLPHRLARLPARPRRTRQPGGVSPEAGRAGGAGQKVRHPGGIPEPRGYAPGRSLVGLVAGAQGPGPAVDRLPVRHPPRDRGRRQFVAARAATAAPLHPHPRRQGLPLDRQKRQISRGERTAGRRHGRLCEVPGARENLRAARPFLAAPGVPAGRRRKRGQDPEHSTGRSHCRHAPGPAYTAGLAHGGGTGV